ncbi:MAG TPA: phosphoribosylanthranilate isomerase [Candidatus Dormibacteraeota bacterium]
MIVKVCGVRTPEVADAAVDAGADLVGLVFVERSPRNVDDRAAGAVREAVAGRADLVGVLVEPSAELCDHLARRHGLAAVQVHGRVDPRLVEQVAVPVVRALNVRSAAEAYTDGWWPASLLLLDAAPDCAGALPGGTGRRLPLEWAAEVARHRPTILAGGLGPENVADAIAAVRPHGVDASSGLESAPGVKDPALVRAYVRTARAAFDLLDMHTANAATGGRG